jgi:hypothetical protein
VTSVLVLAFNRPEHTNVLAARLREFDDIDVYLSIDGPRTGNSSDQLAVRAVRESLHDHLGARVAAERDSRGNLGCADGVTAGLSWFFENVEEGVVLEDDCIPTPEFFEFCAAGLAGFRADPSVGVISGVNYAPRGLSGDAAAVRSRFVHVWGWAAWRRSIDGFSVRVPDWYRSVRRSEAWHSLGPVERYDWKRLFSVAGQPQPHTWDYQFMMHQWISGRDSILPTIPLVENIGFADGTHHAGDPPSYYYMSTQQERRQFIERLRRNPPVMACRNMDVDTWISANIFSPSLRWRAKRRLSHRLGPLMSRFQMAPSTPKQH